MPTRDRERIIRALDEMKTDPLAGDITALRGEYRGLYRRRVGSWRIIFALKTDGCRARRRHRAPDFNNVLRSRI
jgi:mRNA-degrading endonuclease RelE of RelBE toxin-antitoxin system